jgi:hypothetical protein
MCAFLHALLDRLLWAPTLAALAHLPLGKFSADCSIFCTPAAGLLNSCVPQCCPADLEALTLFFLGPTLVTLCSLHSFLPRPAKGPSAGLSSGQPSLFLPEYIRLKKKPAPYVVSVFMAAREWHLLLGPLDAVAATVAEGRMVMPKPRISLLHSRRPNHASWERNKVAKIALGPKFTNWTWQGVVKIVPQGCALQHFIESLGAVDKETAQWWRLILDTSISNEYQDPWGVWYFSISQLAALCVLRTLKIPITSASLQVALACPFGPASSP